MTSVPVASPALLERSASLARPAAVIGAFGAVVLLRWAAWRSGAVDPIGLGGLFGAALVVLAVVAGWRLAPWGGVRRSLGPAALGVAGGAVLVASALLGPHGGQGVWAAGTPGAPWAAATLLVAGAEEALLRGALLDEVADALGLPGAVVATSVIFALMHVPAYGWQAAPLDLGVGFLLAGLRLVSGGVAAPAIAHALADLAVPWL
jgi:membrane protease YdiL (CAAX protease family)